MLTHRNFTSLLAKLLAVYDITHEDGMLSVLPLHHSFEFTTGLLLPLCSRRFTSPTSRRSTGDTINAALKKGHVTCIVGVPALWDGLKRRIVGRLRDRSRRLEEIVEVLTNANSCSATRPA